MKHISSDQFAQIADNLPGAAFMYEIQGNGTQSVRFLNKGCEDLWGVRARDVEADASDLWSIVHPGDLRALANSVRRSAIAMTQWEHRFRIVNAEGEEKHVVGHGAPSTIPSGGVTWVGFLFDITAQTRTKELFERVTQQLNHISAAIPDGFGMFDPKERLIVCNGLFRSFYGLDPDLTFKGMRYEAILRLALETGNFPEAEGRADAWVSEALERFRSAAGFHQERTSGSRWFKTFDRATDDGGRVSFRLDTRETVKRNLALQTAASTDSLTSLANRRGLSEWIEQRSGTLDQGERIVFFISILTGLRPSTTSRAMTQAIRSCARRRGAWSKQSKSSHCVLRAWAGTSSCSRPKRR